MGIRTWLQELISGRRAGITPISQEELSAKLQIWDESMDRGYELLERFNKSSDMGALKEAIDCFRNALRMSSGGVENVGVTFGMLGHALLIRFKHSGDQADLDEAILLCREFVKLAPLGHPSHVASVSNLGRSLMTRFDEVGDRKDMDEAVELQQNALELTPPNDAHHSAKLTNLANSLFARFQQDGDRVDLDRAIKLRQSALKMTPPGHPNRSISLNNLADSLLSRFQQVGNHEDLDEAICLHRGALELTPPGHPLRYLSLNNLAQSLSNRAEHMGNHVDMNEIIDLQQNALVLTPPGHHERSSTINNLAMSFMTRSKYVAGYMDLDEAIKLYRNLLTLKRAEHPGDFSSLSNLAFCLIGRFEITGDRADLDESIDLQKRVLDLTPLGHPNRPLSLSNLARYLFARFQQAGNRADLAEAIVFYQDAVELTPPGHSRRVLILNNLALACFTRFQQLGDHTDLDEAIDLQQSVLKLTPPGHIDRSTSLSNLGCSLFNRFLLLENRADLDEAIVLYQGTLKLTPLGHSDHPKSLNNLGLSLFTRFKQAGDRADLDEAIDLEQSALILTPPGHHIRPSSLNNLAHYLFHRFLQVRNHVDLDEAILLHQSALELRSSGHPERSSTLLNLAEALVARSDYNNLESALHPPSSPSIIRDNRNQILKLLKEATLTTSGPPSARLEASTAWARVAGEWSDVSAMQAYRLSLKLLEIIVASSGTFESRLLHLTSVGNRKTQNLAVDAAACAIAADQVETALEMLEQGRNLLLTQAGMYRTRVDDLKAVNPTLAGDFERIGMKMEASVMDTGVLHPEPSSISATVDVVAIYQKLSEDWTDVVAQIRSLEGFDSFLQPIPFAVLRKSAAEGPVVVVNISEQRSDAIIVHHDRAPYLVHLPYATPSTFVNLVAKAQAKADELGFKILLENLWQLVVEPVIRVLKEQSKLQAGSRIWWCPTGATSHLPLHAAGDYTQAGQNLPDLYVSSYTPTLSALLRARRQLSTRPSTSPDILLVGQPETPGQIKLPSVSLEIQKIKDLVGLPMILDGSAATTDSVLGAMSRYPWIHLACHGHVNQAQPFRSHFSLHSGPLNLLDITRQALPHADLAFLSACHSAAGNRDRPDEVLHLAAAMQFAGFRSVVGTLWAVCDLDGPIVAESFYSSMLGTGGRPVAKSSAHALHRAVGELRMLPGVSFSRWACFVHFGC